MKSSKDNDLLTDLLEKDNTKLDFTGLDNSMSSAENTPEKSKITSSPGSGKKNTKDDSQLFSKGKKGKIKSGGELLTTHDGVFDSYRVKKMCSFGTQLWVAGPGKIALFDTKTVHYLQDISFKVSDKDEVTTLRLITTNTMSFVWCGFKSGKIIVFDAVKRRIYGELPTAHKSKITEICQVDKNVWTASEDCTVRIWNASTQKPLEELIDHHSPVRAICFVPSTRTVWTAGDEHLIKLRHFTSGKVRNTITGFVQGICQMRYTSNTIWITGNKGSVFIFDASKTQCLKEIRAYKCPTYALECTTEEVWTLGEDRVMKVFSVKFQRTVKNIFGTNKEIWVTSLMPVGNGQVWAHCSDGLIRVWSTIGVRVNEKDMKIPVIKKKRRRKKTNKATSQSAIVSSKRKKFSTTRKKTPRSSLSSSFKKKTLNTSTSSRKGRTTKKKYSNVKSKVNTKNESTEYQKELITLRKQLEGATGRIGKYKDRLKKRKGKIKQSDNIMEDFTRKYEETQEKMSNIKENGMKNKEEIGSMNEKIIRMEQEKNEFIKEMIQDLEIKDSNPSLGSVAKEIKKNTLKNESLRKELQYSKQDLLSHIQHLKQIHLNFVKMQKELGQKESLISSLNKLIVETSNKDSETKIETLLNSLKQKNKRRRTNEK